MKLSKIEIEAAIQNAEQLATISDAADAFAIACIANHSTPDNLQQALIALTNRKLMLIKIQNSLS